MSVNLKLLVKDEIKTSLVEAEVNRYTRARLSHTHTRTHIACMNLKIRKRVQLAQLRPGSIASFIFQNKTFAPQDDLHVLVFGLKTII